MVNMGDFDFAHSEMCLLTKSFRYCGREIWFLWSAALCLKVSPDSPMYLSFAAVTGYYVNAVSYTTIHFVFNIK